MIGTKSAFRNLSTRCAALLVSWSMMLCFAQSIYADNHLIEVSDSFLVCDHFVPVYSWSKPNIKPKAVIVTLHGGCLHGRSFRNLAERLVDKDYFVVSLDMRGFGKWFHEGFGSRRDRGFNYKKTIEDIEAVLRHVREDYPGVPVYCLGESLGANVALVIAGGNPELTDGAIVISSVTAPKLFLYPQMLGHLAQVCVNPFRRLNMNVYLKRRLAHDRAMAMEQINDPLARNCQSLPELFRSLFINLKGSRYAKRLPPGYAVLVIHGDRDRLCSHKGALRLYKRIPSHNKRFVLIPDQGHLIVETSNIRPEVFEKLTEWLDKQDKQFYLRARSDSNKPMKSSLSADSLKLSAGQSRGRVKN